MLPEKQHLQDNQEEINTTKISELSSSTEPQSPIEVCLFIKFDHPCYIIPCQVYVNILNLELESI